MQPGKGTCWCAYTLVHEAPPHLIHATTLARLYLANIFYASSGTFAMVTNNETQCSNAVRKEIALQLCLTLRFAPWLHFLCYINSKHHIGPSCYIIGNSKNEEYFWNYLRVPGNQYSVNSSWKQYCSATWLPVTLRNSFPTDLFPALRK